MLLQAQQQKKKDKLLTMDPKEITYELVNRKLREIVMSRGRKGTDKQEQVEMLTYLITVAKGSAQRFECYAQLVSSLFDMNPSMASHLKTSLWKKCIINLLEMLKILQDNPNITVSNRQRFKPSCMQTTRACMHICTVTCTDVAWFSWKNQLYT